MPNRTAAVSGKWENASGDTLLTRAEAAEYLGRSKSWLANAVTYKMENVPKPDGMDGRLAVYKLSSLRAWQRANGIKPAPRIDTQKAMQEARAMMGDDDENTQTILINGLENMLNQLKQRRDRKKTGS